ncbi:GNAT family N-acetyltransferase [Marinobacter lacisalsi]|uniref:GNAT family N-acetyltransferase n=1 Tax=Marinobacter lacisalsi TaxID=475979 RepID=A0ABV8QD54_9GAMM
MDIRRATEADADAVSDCVTRAYEHYEKRIGRTPGPMVQDYHKVIREYNVFVTVVDQEIQGVLVLDQTREGFLLDNIAVNPGLQGRGIGRALLELAEQCAQSAGYDSIYLYTNALMSENRELYARIGYEEYDHRTEQGLDRVYLRKPLPRGPN